MTPCSNGSPFPLALLTPSPVETTPSRGHRWIHYLWTASFAATVLLLTAACASGPASSRAAASATAATPVVAATAATSATPEPTASPSVVATQTAPVPESTKVATPVPRATTSAPATTVRPTLPPVSTSGLTAGATKATGAQQSPSPSPTATAAPTQQAARRTVQSWVDGPTALSSGQATGLQLSNDGARLAQGTGGYAASGQLLSEIHSTEFPFDNAVLSWNADTPAGTSLRFELRARIGNSWTGWYTMGRWGSEGGRSVSGQSDSNGRVDIDTLKLNFTATAIQYRVEMNSSSPSNTPLLRQLSVVYADRKAGLTGPPLARPAGGVRDLPVPGQSQLEQDPSVALDICSPTSLAMVLQYWGLKKTVPQVYAGVQDHTTGIYGDWPFNTAYAGANGFNARVDRFYSMDQVEQEIAAGRPVIMSIAYGPGELTGAAASSTDGHLIVVRGFTASGDVIVNDPVAPNSRSVRLVYNRAQLSRVWLRSGGIVYLISPR